MTESATQFIERLGLVAEEEGFPRTSGRILGLLLLHEEPLSLDQVAERLLVSKASASTNARLLESLGVVERFAAPGDRRDYYQVTDDPWKRMLGVARRRLARMSDVLAEGEDCLPHDMARGRRRMKDWQRFYAFVLGDLDRRLERLGTDSRRAAPAAPPAEHEAWGD
jgi:DNA-binding MarR family transcriptional regulator